MIKPIALYLPQFHPIPENDQWWENGFTEWTNVKKAQSLFEGHYQPHKPLNNNYYDLRDISVMERQAALAEKYGIYGFCFYHYWFNEKLLLEAPLHNWLKSQKPNFPFCLSWANENWTRRWDGKEKEILMKQEYSSEDDLKHIQYLMQFFKDSRYIKVDNKPVFLVYRSELHPNIKKATDIWRNEAKKKGFDDLFLIRMENFERDIDPKEHGFDAGMEFAPDSTMQGTKTAKKSMVKYLFNKTLHYTGISRNPVYENGIYDYPTLVKNMSERIVPDYKYFRCICPSWDNSPRRKKHAILYHHASPKIFEKWVKSISRHTENKFSENEQFLFINAWNEWGEGCHLEPDERWGYGYLEVLKQTLRSDHRGNF